MQSLALGKKTIVLGKAVYSYLKATFKPKKIEDIRKIINTDWTKTKAKNQKKDFIKYINSILNSENVIDNEAVYWSQKKNINDIIDVDIGLYKILKNYLK